MKISTCSSRILSRHVAWKASDFTLQEYANAIPSVKNTARLKKSVVNTFHAQNMEGNKENEELAWYEKDLSDFDLSESEELIEETPTRKSKKTKTKQPDNKSGVVYTIDLWFLIGEHVHPEDVQRFAAICRGTHIVSHSARFWINIYQRLIADDEAAAKNLPYELSPSRMRNMHGFRARVIRTLFILHGPFKDRLKALQPFGKDPDMLVGYRCCLSWYKQDKNLWYFYFKFNNPHRKLCRMLSADVVKRKRDLLDDDNIHYNSEEGNYVLQVVSQNFQPVPVVMGETLNKASLSVGLTMRYHKIRLEFDHSFHKQSLYSNQVVIDPVLNMQVFPWWHPAYPCNPAQ